jgi:hypothetical protein
MPKRPAPDDPARPNVYRSTYLVLKEILADDNPDPAEVAHREWLKRRLDEVGRFVASIPARLVSTSSSAER